MIETLLQIKYPVIKRFSILLPVVALFATINALGRIGGSLICNRIQTSSAVQSNLFSPSVLLYLSPVYIDSRFSYLLFAFAAGFNYGGVRVIYASSTAQIWGTSQAGQVYGWLFSANIPAALSPMISGYGRDRTGSFTLPKVILASLLLAATVVTGRQQDLINKKQMATLSNAIAERRKEI